VLFLEIKKESVKKKAKSMKYPKIGVEEK